MSTGIGDALRQAREEQGRSLEEAARDTRVRGDYLRALEGEEFGVFGGDVYAKGFLSSYARYLKLDPTPLLETYRRQVQQDDSYDTAALRSSAATAPPRDPLPRWVSWGVIAVVVLAGALALANVVGGRSPEPAAEPTEGVTSPTATPTEAATATPTPTPTPAFDGVNVELVYEGDSWSHVEVDGETVLEGVVEAGETATYEGEENVFVWLGNAGAVNVVFNGEDIGPLGARGEVVRVTFTPDGPAPS